MKKSTVESTIEDLVWGLYRVKYLSRLELPLLLSFSLSPLNHVTPSLGYEWYLVATME